MEIWKDIKGYEGVYMISSFGRVMSLPRKKGARSSRKIISLKYDANGYARVSLWKNNKGRDEKVHRLVACAFLGEPPEGKSTVNHKDGRPWNNFVWNLEWASQLENNMHAINVLKNRFVAVARYDMNMKHIKDYESVTAASDDTGAEKTNIVKACRAFPKKTCAGFLWKYISKPRERRKMICYEE